MAAHNRTWGYTRIQGALQNLGHEIGRGTIAKVLKEAGMDPAPERQKKTTWKEFLRTHWDVLGAAGFFSDCRYLIHDRASLFSQDFAMIIEAAGTESVRLPAHSPNLNAIAERFVRSIIRNRVGTGWF